MVAQPSDSNAHGPPLGRRRTGVFSLTWGVLASTERPQVVRPVTAMTDWRRENSIPREARERRGPQADLDSTEAHLDSATARIDKAHLDSAATDLDPTAGGGASGLGIAGASHLHLQVLRECLDLTVRSLSGGSGGCNRELDYCSSLGCSVATLVSSHDLMNTNATNGRSDGVSGIHVRGACRSDYLERTATLPMITGRESRPARTPGPRAAADSRDRNDYTVLTISGRIREAKRRSGDPSG